MTPPKTAPIMLRMNRTDETLEALEEALCKNHGDLVAACRALAISPRHVHMWMQQEPTVSTRIRAAQMIGWAGLESVLYERAVTGIEEDIYYQGDIIGTKVVRSDALLSLMAKARIPGYNAETQHNHTHMVNVNVMPRATSYEEWREQREQELSPADTVIEGKVKELEYVPKVVGYHADPFERGLKDVL